VYEVEKKDCQLINCGIINIKFTYNLFYLFNNSKERKAEVALSQNLKNNQNNMNTAKFLKETTALENKLRSKVGDEPERLGFTALVKRLISIGQIDEQTVTDLKKLWELRNKVYSTPIPDNNISGEAQTLLASLISNSKLQ
jgi:hypothetical protein